jgi:hypothetical protein
LNPLHQTGEQSTSRASAEWHPATLESLRRLIGVDGAVAFTIAARIVQIAGSVVTVSLILRFMTPLEQGYYYTLLSLAALQIVFELGFSYVILQMATHESAHLTFTSSGELTGDPAARVRLASICQLVIRWYLGCAALFAAVLTPLGIVFFSMKDPGRLQAAWFGPWLSAVLAMAVVLFMTPLFSFLEGCHQVRQVAMLRMQQAVMVALCSWAAIASGHGLYACAAVNCGWIAPGLAFLRRRRELIRSLWRNRSWTRQVSWTKEIWPFQWKIAVSSLCSYFAMQVFTPILFAARGPVEAGRFGLSFGIAVSMQSVALAWITPKAAPFGQLVALERTGELNRVFFRTLKQSAAALLGLAGGCLGGVIALGTMAPELARRMEPLPVFALLLAGAGAAFAVQALAIYLRAFKREPYLNLSLSTSFLMALVSLLLAPHWGGAGIAAVYAAVNWLVVLPWALAIFDKRRSEVSDLRRANQRVEPVHWREAGILPSRSDVQP